jgi:hypothetical protein
LILTCSPTPSFFCRATDLPQVAPVPKAPTPLADRACVPRGSFDAFAGRAGAQPHQPVRATARRAACGDGYRGRKTHGKPFLMRFGKCLWRKAFFQISDFETMPRSGSIHRDT